MNVLAPGCLVNARAPAAVAAGNTETSSRIVDVVFAALSHALPVPAQGQGTMNNVVLGNERFTYYETIGGGQGGCPDAVASEKSTIAMSNTLSTPIEALELAYPLRVERYALRLGSGGDGRFRGGDGVVRELRALEPCRLSLLHAAARARAQGSGRRGATGLPGRNLLNGVELPRVRHRRPRSGRRPPDRDARRRRLRRRGHPVKGEALVAVELLQVERALRPVVVDHEVARVVGLRDREVAGAEEPPCVLRPLEGPVRLGVRDVARRGDGDVDHEDAARR